MSAFMFTLIHNDSPIGNIRDHTSWVMRIPEGGIGAVLVKALWVWVSCCIWKDSFYA